MEILTLGTCEFRASQDAKTGKLVGYAALFDTWSERIGFFRERIEPGAFTRTLSKGADVRALREHDPAQMLGRSVSGTLELSQDERGLLAEITPPDTQLGRDTIALVRRGDLSQMSFGFTVPKGGDEWNDEGDERTLKDVDLFDVSVVAYPAYNDTSVGVAKRYLEMFRSGRNVVPAVGDSTQDELAKRKAAYIRRLKQGRH